MIELDARGWLDWLNLPVTGPVESIESDVGTVLAEVDKVLRIGGPAPWLAHIEAQANRDPRLPSRLLQYHALLHHRHDLRVRTTVVLLRPEADGPELTGYYEIQDESDGVTVSFRYRVIRLWEQPIQELLRAGLGVLPLAPLADVAREAVHPILQALDERISRETDRTTAGEIAGVLYLLLLLRYDEDEVRAMLRPSQLFRETALGRELLEEARALGEAEGRERGRLLEARDILLELGANRLGPPDQTVVSQVERIDDVDVLRRLTLRALTASSWSELLAGDEGH